MLKFDKIEQAPTPPPPSYTLSGLTLRQAQVLKTALYDMNEKAKKANKMDLGAEVYTLIYALETQQIYTSDSQDLYAFRS